MSAARSILTRAGLSLVQASFARHAHSFAQAARQPQRAQAKLLAELAASAANTTYGQDHGVRTPEQFRSRLPIVRYEDLLPYLEEQQAKESCALASGKVLFYEKTSGSSGPAKYIPYTSALRRSFTRMFQIWAHDVLSHGPRFATGTCYFSISPSFSTQRATERGVPVGLDDDADYLGPALKRVLRPFFVSAIGGSCARDAESWKRAVASALVLRADLEIVSVWNPSMLSVLLDTIEQERLTLGLQLGADPRAAALLGSQVDWQRLWPALKLVSCWTSAAAAPLATALSRRLPHVMLQGKGLLATEAPLTLPLIKARGFVPLVDEVFFELEDIHTGALHLLHEVTAGKSYELIISQKGGLCRYRMGDRVRVTHFYGDTPCLELIGRGHDTSDLVGEKLHEGFVAEALGALPLDFASFWSLLPAREPLDHYVLLVDRDPHDAEALSQATDRALSQAHHYAHARSLGQLGPVRVAVRPRAADLVRDHHARRGIRWGDQKHRLLFTEPADELLREVAAS